MEVASLFLRPTPTLYSSVLASLSLLVFEALSRVFATKVLSKAVGSLQTEAVSYFISHVSNSVVELNDRLAALIPEPDSSLNLLLRLCSC